MRIKLILAGNKGEACFYAKKQGLLSDQWKFVTGAHDLLGTSKEGFEFIITGTADERPDFPKLCKIGMCQGL